MNEKWKKLFAYAVAIAAEKDYISDYLFDDSFLGDNPPVEEDGEVDYRAIWDEFDTQFEEFFGVKRYDVY